jgi:hypothetical protein
MGFEAERALQSGASWATALPVVGGTLRNPVYTALLITALAMVVIFLQFRHDLKHVSGRQMLRAGFYAFLGVSLLVYVHYYALAGSIRQQHSQHGIREVVGSIYGHSSHPGAFRVEPRGVGSTPGGMPQQYAAAGVAAAPQVIQGAGVPPHERLQDFGAPAPAGGLELDRVPMSRQ